MTKALELAGLALVVVMILSFVGALSSAGIEPGLSMTFWICAAGTLMIIMYRKTSKKSKDV